MRAGGLRIDEWACENLFVWAIFCLDGLLLFGYMPRKERTRRRTPGEVIRRRLPHLARQRAATVPTSHPFCDEPAPVERELFKGGDDQYSGNKELPTTLQRWH
jgi:hypothetical protein